MNENQNNHPFSIKLVRMSYMLPIYARNCIQNYHYILTVHAFTSFLRKIYIRNPSEILTIPKMFN